MRALFWPSHRLLHGRLIQDMFWEGLHWHTHKTEAPQEVPKGNVCSQLQPWSKRGFRGAPSTCQIKPCYNSGSIFLVWSNLVNRAQGQRVNSNVMGFNSYSSMTLPTTKYINLWFKSCSLNNSRTADAKPQKNSALLRPQKQVRYITVDIVNGCTVPSHVV